MSMINTSPTFNVGISLRCTKALTDHKPIQSEDYNQFSHNGDGTAESLGFWEKSSIIDSYSIVRVWPMVAE